MSVPTAVPRSGKPSRADIRPPMQVPTPAGLAQQRSACGRSVFGSHAGPPKGKSALEKRDERGPWSTFAHLLRMRLALVLIAILAGACSSPPTTVSDQSVGPSCDASDLCVYSSQGAGVCHQSCDTDASACPIGQICTGTAACCGGGGAPLVPSGECSSPAVLVCCSDSGC